MTMRWVIAAGLVFGLAVAAAAQAADPWDEPERLATEGNYGAALERAIALRGEKGRSLRADGLIALCACQIPEKSANGREYFAWLLERSDYAMSREQRAHLATEAARCGYAPPWVRVSMEPPPPGHAGLSAASKMFHLLATRVGADGTRGADAPLTTEPLRFQGPGPAEDPRLAAEFRSRVFPPEQAQAALETVREVAGSTFRVAATDAFLVASSAGHTDLQLRQIGDVLERFRGFLETTYRLVPLDHRVTFYLLPSKEDLRVFAGRVHHLSVGDMCIGYSFPADASIAAVIPGERIGTLLHELAHTVVTSRFAELPPWLEEGLASLYEESKQDGTRFTGVFGWRQELLEELWFLRPSVPDLLSMPSDAFHGVGSEIERQAVNHALARTLLLYVQDQARLTEIFTAFRPPSPLDPPLPAPPNPVARFASALGADASRLDDDFSAWFRGHSR